MFRADGRTVYGREVNELPDQWIDGAFAELAY